MMLRVELYDEHGAPCCANVGIFKSEKRVWRAYVGETGEISLEPGIYRLVIQRGKQYWPITREVTLTENATLRFDLKRVHDPKLLGFYAFDAHSHISRKYFGPDAPMNIETMSVRARGEDWNVYFAGTPYDGENHQHVYQNNHLPIESYRAYYRPLLNRLARPDYLVDPGGEFIKYRYGHIVLANFVEKPPVNEFRDPLYYAYEKERHVPATAEPPFENVPPSQALNMYRDENSFAFFAHPTSWWREERGNPFVTNIASTVAFDGLTGMVDAIVVEGYGADKPWYRGIWYALLDAGYRIAGIAETDTCADDDDHMSGARTVEPFRTYARCEKLDLNLLSAAVRRGDCFASSGPLLDLSLEGQRPGSLLPHDPDREYTLSLKGWACCEGELTDFEVVVNGETFAHVAPDENGEAKISVRLQKEGYVLAILRDAVGNVAVGNPIYVRNTPFLNDGFKAHVTIDVTYNGRGANGFFTTDESNDPVVFDTRVVCDINPMSKIQVTVDGKTKVYDPFFDPQLQAHFRYAYGGEFTKDYPHLFKGEVPPEVFRISQIVERLRHLDASMDFGASPTALNALRTQHTFETGAPNDLARASAFQGLAPDQAALPDPEDFSARVPRLIWEGHADACSAMARAFALAGSKLMRPDPESGLPRRLLYTEFADSVFMWGNCFNTMYGEYAAHLFPFIEMLDNFYAKQHADGFICRQIDIHTGADQFEKHDPSATGPDLFSLAEWRHYSFTGDRERLKRVYAPLLAFHQWLRKNHTWQSGGYFSSGWGSGMDNIPRRSGPDYNPAFDTGHLCFIDATAQQALDARLLIKMAEECGLSEGREALQAEYDALTRLINESMWSEADGFYEDTDEKGQPTGVMHVGAYWTLLASVVPSSRLARFTAHLENEREFLSPMGIRSLSASHPDFCRDGGNYWQGGVWCITDLMVFLGLEFVGLGEMARRLCRRHVMGVARVFAETGTIWESYDPVRTAPGRLYGKLVRKDFVGFSGVTPIVLALEGVIGVRPWPDSLEWTITMPEKHGVENLPVAGQTICLLYEKGTAVIRCEKALTLCINGQKYALSAGENRLENIQPLCTD